MFLTTVVVILWGVSSSSYAVLGVTFVDPSARSACLVVSHSHGRAALEVAIEC